MSALLDTLASYVPQLVVRRFAANPAPLTAPEAERFPAAVLFADISGFTPLAERMARRGPAGTEELTRILNAYFSQLIDLITTMGGDVIKFAGDATLAVWPAGEEDLAIAARRAAQCAAALQMILHNYEAGEGIRLSMRMGIGAGDIMTASVGGMFKRWEFLVVGDPLVQMSAADKQAKPGEVILSAQVRQLLGDQCIGEELPTGAMRLEDVRSPLPLRAPAPIKLAPEVETSLRAYIPGAILSRLDAGQTEWLAELRYITVIFLNVTGLDYNAPDALDRLQATMHGLQTALYRYEGSVNQFLLDDKGANLIAALGLPPLAHEDDAARGIQAAMDMHAKLSELGLHSTIGIASGPMFCGSRGNGRRREYAMIGDVINLSARLMQAVKNRPHDSLPILCDEATFQAAQAQIEFETLPHITVKGKTDPVAIFCPLRKKKIVFRPKAALVGRSKEHGVLAESLQHLVRSDNCHVIVIEGEAGIGKSRLVEDLRRQAEGMRLTVFSGSGDAIDQSTPYYAWRDIFNQMLDISILNAPEAKQRHMLELLEELDPELVEFAPLLNSILLLNFPDTDLTAQMSGQVRADNTRDLLLRMLQVSADRSPKVIILEDAHWLDSASWALVARVMRYVRPVLIVIATRPLGEGWQRKKEAPPEYRQLLEAPFARHIRLGELSPEETLELVSQRLGVLHISKPVADLLLEKAGGHPFFAEELAYALRDSGIVQVTGQECQLAPETGDLSKVDFPHTVQGVVTSRIDRLKPPEQLTLKVASVIGRTFDVQILQDVYPIGNDKSQLAAHLQNLEQFELTVSQKTESGLVYIFKHTITREVAYNLMPFSQRQKLHQEVAQWYERVHANDLHAYYGLLAYHWRHGNDIAQALDYLEKAGEAALREGAHKEAVNFLSEALELDKASAGLAAPLRQARWERMLGDVFWQSGKLAESIQHCQHALEILGQAEPPTRNGLLLGVLRQLPRQAAHYVWPDRFLGRHQDDARRIELGRAYWQLSETYAFDNQILPSLHAGFCGLNLIEGAGPGTPDLARAYAGSCWAMGGLGLHPLAQGYKRRTQETLHAAKSLPAKPLVLTRLGLYDTGIGQWNEAQDILQEAVQEAERLGNWRLLGESLTNLWTMNYYRGRFSGLEEAGQRVYDLGCQHTSPQMQAWGLNLQAMHCSQIGQTKTAIGLLEQAQNLATDRVTVILNRGLLAVAHLRAGNLRPAQQAADEARRLIGKSWPMWVLVFDGYVAIPEVYLALWENLRLKMADFAGLPLRTGAFRISASGTSAPKGEEYRSEILNLKSDAHTACAALERYARVFPIGQPRYWLCMGWYHWLEGNAARAEQDWKKSRDAAKKLGMPYEEGLTRCEVGRHTNGVERQRYLSHAVEIFARLGAAYDLQRAQAALNENN